MPTIAVIEDDASVLDAVRLVLELEGWTVQAYVPGEAFLVDFTHQRPDCIILDPHLPGVSGVEVARAVVSESSVPVICLTAQPDSPTTKAISRLGARAMLTKPVSAETLIEQIRVALSDGSGTGSDSVRATPD